MMKQTEINNSNNNNNNNPNDIVKRPGACGNCNIKRRSLITFPCKYIICSKCLEKCVSGKRYKCDNCDKAHNLVSNVTDTDLLEKIKQLNNKTNTLNNCYLEISKKPGRKRRLSVDNLPIGQQNNINNSNNNLKRKRLSLGDNLKINTTTNDESKLNNEIIRKRGRKSLVELQQQQQQQQQQQEFHSHLTDKTNNTQTLSSSNVEQNTNKRRSSIKNSIQNSDNISQTLGSSSNEKPSSSSSASSQSKPSNENTLNNKNEIEQEKDQEQSTTNPKLKSILKRNESVTTDSGINSQASLTIETSSNNIEPQKRARKSSIKSSKINENAKQHNKEEKKAVITKNENINTSKENIDSNKKKSKRNKDLLKLSNENVMNENKIEEKHTPQPNSNARSRSRSSSRKKLVDESNNNTQALVQITNTQNRRRRSNSTKYTTTNTSKQTTQINEYNKSYIKLPFDFKRCISKGKLKLYNKFKLNGLSDKRNEYVCIKPFYDNKLLFCYRNTVYIRDQLGNVLKEKKLETRSRSIIREVTLNDKFIFVSSESQISNEVFISKYDYELNYIDEIVVYCECFSLACNNNRLFYVGLYYDILYRLNHTVIYVYDCETFQFVTELLWEGSNDSNNINDNSNNNNNDKKKINDNNSNNNYENRYLPDRYLGPPQTIIHHNRIYFCYSNYGDDTQNRVDFANTESLINEGTLMMPEWFLNYKIDANGNFIYYQHNTKSFCVFNSNGELIRRLELDKPLNNYGVFCITNDGRLAIVRETFDVEIY